LSKNSSIRSGDFAEDEETISVVDFEGFDCVNFPEFFSRNNFFELFKFDFRLRLLGLLLL